MKVYTGDWIDYKAELFRIKKRGFQRLDREGSGQVVQKISTDLYLVDNGIRICLVHRVDITNKY